MVAASVGQIAMRYVVEPDNCCWGIIIVLDRSMLVSGIDWWQSEGRSGQCRYDFHLLIVIMIEILVLWNGHLACFLGLIGRSRQRSTIFERYFLLLLLLITMSGYRSHPIGFFPQLHMMHRSGISLAVVAQPALHQLLPLIHLRQRQLQLHRSWVIIVHTLLLILPIRSSWFMHSRRYLQDMAVFSLLLMVKFIDRPHAILDQQPLLQTVRLELIYSSVKR